MKKKKPKNKGILFLFLGAILLVLSLLINRYIEINDIYCIIFLVISIIVELLGLYHIIKDNK